MSGATVQRAHQITGVVFLLIAAFLGYHAVKLRYYTPLGPGPGFFPIWLCAILGLLAVTLFFQARLATPEPHGPADDCHRDQQRDQRFEEEP